MHGLDAYAYWHSRRLCIIHYTVICNAHKKNGLYFLIRAKENSELCFVALPLQHAPVKGHAGQGQV